MADAADDTIRAAQRNKRRARASALTPTMLKPLATIPRKHRPTGRKFWHLLRTAPADEAAPIAAWTRPLCRQLKSAKPRGRPPNKDWRVGGLARRIAGLAEAHPSWKRDRLLNAVLNDDYLVKLLRADGISPSGMKTRLVRAWPQFEEFNDTHLKFVRSWSGQLARAIPDIVAAEREGWFNFDDDELASSIWRRWRQVRKPTKSS